MYHIIVLNTVLRQDEPLLISAIKDLSTGYLSPESVAFLKSLSCPLPTACQPTFLYARNNDVMLACFDFLCELCGKEKSYQSADEGKVKELYSLKVPKVLVLNNNSKVMLTVNLSNKLENGSLGVVEFMGQNYCTVNLHGVGLANIKPYCFTVFSQETMGNIASRTQLQLKSAYSITMHKAQGMTLANVDVDAKHATNPGQLATAVGRAMSASSLQLRNFDEAAVSKQVQVVSDYYTHWQQHDN